MSLTLQTFSSPGSQALPFETACVASCDLENCNVYFIHVGLQTYLVAQDFIFGGHAGVFGVVFDEVDKFFPACFGRQWEACADLTRKTSQIVSVSCVIALSIPSLTHIWRNSKSLAWDSFCPIF